MGVGAVVTVLVGLAVLLFGRQLFWLFVGAAGFAVGLRWAAEVLGGQPEWVILVVALVIGGLGALLAVFLQLVALGLGGFLAGAYAMLVLARGLGVEDGRSLWIAVFVAGIVAAALVLWLWDWALVVLSSVTGAALLIQLTHFTPVATALTFLLLLVVGLAFQTYQLAGREPQARARTGPGASRR